MLWNILLILLCLVVIYSLLANIYYIIGHLRRKEYQGSVINFMLLILQILILIFLLKPEEMFQSLMAIFTHR